MHLDALKLIFYVLKNLVEVQSGVNKNPSAYLKYKDGINDHLNKETKNL